MKERKNKQIETYNLSSYQNQSQGERDAVGARDLMSREWRDKPRRDGRAGVLQHPAAGIHRTPRPVTASALLQLGQRQR